MLDFSNFHQEYPDPDREAVLRVIKEAQVLVVEHFALAVEPGTTTLRPIRKTDTVQTIRTYVQAYTVVQQLVIPTLQDLLPTKFSNLIQSKFMDWISFPEISSKKPL